MGKSEVGKRAACLAEAPRSGAKADEGGSNSVVESQPSKLLVAGSIPVSRSSLRSPFGELRLGRRVSRQAKAVSPKREARRRTPLRSGVARRCRAWVKELEAGNWELEAVMPM